MSAEDCSVRLRFHGPDFVSNAASPHSISVHDESVEPERRASERESVAILVHGTFAGDQSNEGEKWWQTGSPFSRKLQRHLPEGVRLAEGHEVFHWSGDNSERARSKAAGELLGHLRQHEADGKDYHLIGHSHGGSVVWQSLKMATLKDQRLPGLRSWTTVGTPYLQHKSRAPYNPINVIGIVVAVLILFPFFRSVTMVSSVFWHAAMGGKPALIAQTDMQIGYGAILRAPLIVGIEKLGVPVDRAEDGFRLGSYDPAGDQSLPAYLCTTWEGVVLIGAAMLHIYVALQLIVWGVTPALESRRIRRERRLEKHAYYRFGSRWLGLWSPDDEAINGLRATLGLSVRFVGKMMPRERVFISDTTALISRPIFWMIAPIFNLVIQPILDRFVRNMVTRSAQGNDRPTATLIEVTPTPLKEIRHDFAALPPLLNDQLVRFSDRHAKSLAPKLRKWLGLASFETGIQSFAGELSGQELIHTSYFEHDEIAALICCNISLGTPRVALPRNQIAISPVLIDWFESTKRELSRNCGPDPIRTERPLENPIRRAA